MPISFLEQDTNSNGNGNEKQSNDPRLKARLLVREFASHRYGLFKESGFRNDFMYPPFASLAGLSLSSQRTNLFPNRTMSSGDDHQQQTANGSASGVGSGNDWLADYSLRGFDSDWNECSFDTQPESGLPTSQSAGCLPYLTRLSPTQSDKSSSSFNLMSADPFSHADLSARFVQQQQQRPVEWRELADSVKWHFCGDNFATPAQLRSTPVSNDLTVAAAATTTQSGTNQNRQESYAHNQLANNKQNVLCQERSAMEIIKASEDFKRPTFR